MLNLFISYRVIFNHGSYQEYIVIKTDKSIDEIVKMLAEKESKYSKSSWLPAIEIINIQELSDKAYKILKSKDD